MGHANRHRRQSPTARRLGAAGAVGVLCAVPLVASASPAQAADGDRTAVVGPLLDFFNFGAAVGTPLACGAASAGLGSGFQEFGAADQGNTVVDGILQGCALVAEQGTLFIDQGKVMQAPYAEAFNPVANPVLEHLATATTDFGTQFGPALAPFGPTIAGSGNTIRFLIGTSADDS